MSCKTLRGELLNQELNNLRLSDNKLCVIKLTRVSRDEGEGVSAVGHAAPTGARTAHTQPVTV